jgi:hypothetical protein
MMTAVINSMDTCMNLYSVDVKRIQRTEQLQSELKEAISQITSNEIKKCLSAIPKVASHRLVTRAKGFNHVIGSASQSTSKFALDGVHAVTSGQGRTFVKDLVSRRSPMGFLTSIM